MQQYSNHQESFHSHQKRRGEHTHKKLLARNDKSDHHLLSIIHFHLRSPVHQTFIHWHCRHQHNLDEYLLTNFLTLFHKKKARLITIKDK